MSRSGFWVCAWAIPRGRRPMGRGWGIGPGRPGPRDGPAMARGCGQRIRHRMGHRASRGSRAARRGGGAPVRVHARPPCGRDGGAGLPPTPRPGIVGGTAGSSGPQSAPCAALAPPRCAGSLPLVGLAGPSPLPDPLGDPRPDPLVDPFELACLVCVAQRTAGLELASSKRIKRGFPFR
jgi:hypothetical protein